MIFSALDKDASFSVSKTLPNFFDGYAAMFRVKLFPDSRRDDEFHVFHCIYKLENFKLMPMLAHCFSHLSDLTKAFACASVP